MRRKDIFIWIKKMPIILDVLKHPLTISKNNKQFNIHYLLSEKPESLV